MGFIISMTMLAIVVVVIGFILVSVWREDNGPRKLSKAERIELESARRSLSQVRDLGIEYRALDTTDLPFRLLDIIDQHTQKKEMGS